jgi:plastocyanin
MQSKSMISLKSSLIVIGSLGLVFLGACSNSNQAANTEKSPTISTSSANSPASPVTKTSSQHGESKGGQVVETGAYHLEFVAEKEANGTHIDFYLQKGDNHEAISNAKVKAQVQTPDGKQKTLNLAYDKEGKHYTVFLPEKSSGQYQVKMLVDIDGKKVDGRFSFNK